MEPTLFTESARQFAREAHDSIGQRRKYSGEPYWVHTDEVMSIVMGVDGATEEMAAAAALHDTEEDVAPANPAYSLERIRSEFGSLVAQYVDELTDRYTKEAYPNLNRKERKRLECERLGAVSNEAKTIKLADLISNSKDILQNDPSFAKTYLREKRDLLPYLKGGNPTLLARNQEFLQEYFK